GDCNRIDPNYHPIISPEIFDGKNILVIWAPASDNRPHRAPDGPKADRKYWVRLHANTVDASVNGVLEELLGLTAKIPFDDRRSFNSRIEDLRESKVREFLRDIRSGLIDEKNTKDLYRKLRISVPVNGYDAPKNIGLLFFSDNAEDWFPGARVEVVQFADYASGDIIEEKFFRGALHEQARQALSYLESFSSLYTEKKNSFEATGFVSYPIPALREALINAVYHRSYELHEPIKIYLYPDRIEIISYPGPVQGIKMKHLLQEESIPPVPARNRRIGEFLKELRLAEGRGTGLPKLYRAMKDNGSPLPQFEFDEGRTYFKVTLPAHPEYVAIATLRDAAHLRALGREAEAFERIEESWESLPNSSLLASEYIKHLVEQGKIGKAESIYSEFKSANNITYPYVAKEFIESLINNSFNEVAAKYLGEMPKSLDADLALETAILSRRLHKEKEAHQYFEKAGSLVLKDARSILEFAQCKLSIANQYSRDKRRYSKAANDRLLNESLQLLERLVSMDTDRVKLAWGWRELARVKNWLKFPEVDIEAAYKNAIDYGPDVDRIIAEYNKWTNRSRTRNQR
ncbi:hypothetical protein LJB81_03025, partial [Desulfovibrio sp. OttesenSCG-928-M14]|nr:hypothetical protein [Desulfovibrio sp. OttesenSCG-928-M14]